ncbi:MAG: 50S ribosomal protein L18 [Alphaproteobacteria bacterium MarineAlpha9_Bin4]|mgnify:CR=1 FL=1|nr:50S ribosomal protein L18 [Pelagibacterales bacterium]PPR24546.1 MAG: 50S ribosomal protein L18 [Alphaproteobacteria bacterium MarineAlpha9_Bin4]|tara:strand:+ start:1761 stop:2129 length:369 start_codon:yes stop_codon:yes gene_type:complete
MSAKSRVLFNKRKARNRFSIRAKATSDLRLTVFRSNTNFYCQIINDQKGVTLLSVSSLDKNLKKEIKKNAGNKIAAEIVGLEVAKRASKEGIKKVFFDRGGYLYHGRVKAFADAARKEGLKF